MLKLLVFDLDGTLVDTQRDLGNAVRHALIQSGNPSLPLEAVMANVGDGAYLLIERSLKAAQNGRTPDPAEVETSLAAFLEYYSNHCLVESAPYPGVSTALEKLVGYRKAVLTNKPYEPSQRILEGLGLAHHFEWIVGGDNPFGKKPNPAALNHIVASAKVTAHQTLMIGDGVQDIRAARQAGTRFLGFLNGIGNREALLAEQPEATIEEMRFVPEAMLDLEK